MAEPLPFWTLHDRQLVSLAGERGTAGDKQQMDTLVSGVEDKSIKKHSPNNVHICVSIAHIQSQQRSDVIRWRG